MSLLCRLFGHQEGGLIAVEGSGRFGARRCHRCFQAVGGVAIETPENLAPAPTRMAAPQSRIWWVKAVYVREA